MENAVDSEPVRRGLSGYRAGTPYRLARTRPASAKQAGQRRFEKFEM
jgi:hypothetical protein